MGGKQGLPVQLRLSPVSLLAAMKDEVRTLPVSRLSPPVHLLTELLNEPRGRNVNQRM